MPRKLVIAGAALAAALSLTSAAFAGASDYSFEPVNAEVKKGAGVTVTVRLVQKQSGKPVSGAVMVSPRIDMTPEGMPTMTAPITPAAGAEPGNYSFKTDLPMAGRWLLTVSAKVQGEQETVTGKVTFRATE